MGVDVTHIIRHDFKDVKNHKAAKKYLLLTLELLKEKFCIHLDSSDGRFKILSEDTNEMCFCFFPFDYTFFLRDGFWQIESNFKIHQLVKKDKENNYWLRNSVYDIARALGQNEAWHAEEFYTWNCRYWDIETINFNTWLKKVKRRVKKEHGKEISRFPPESETTGTYYAWGNGVCYDPIYHDMFIGCDEKFKELQSRITDYRLLGISSISHICANIDFLQCEKDGYLYLIDEHTLKPMNKEPIDAICRVYNEVEVIYKI